MFSDIKIDFFELNANPIVFHQFFFFKNVLYSKNKDVKLGRAWLAILHVLKKSIASFPVKYQQKTIRLCKRKNSPYFSFQLHSAITKKNVE